MELLAWEAGKLVGWEDMDDYEHYPPGRNSNQHKTLRECFFHDEDKRWKAIAGRISEGMAATIWEDCGCGKGPGFSRRLLRPVGNSLAQSRG